MVVIEKYRGHGLGLKMLQAVEDHAQKKGCCKVTLEVLEGNKVARNAYLKFGFAGYQLDPDTGNALFMEKALSL